MPGLRRKFPLTHGMIEKPRLEKPAAQGIAKNG
jgi:hypothetical protein